jgi:hypothetical protein
LTTAFSVVGGTDRSAPRTKDDGERAGGYVELAEADVGVAKDVRSAANGVASGAIGVASGAKGAAASGKGHTFAARDVLESTFTIACKGSQRFLTRAILSALSG